MMKPVQDYGVRVVRPFMQFSPGFVMYPTAIYREALLKSGFVELVETGPLDRDVVSPPDRTMRGSPGRKAARA